MTPYQYYYCSNSNPDKHCVDNSESDEMSRKKNIAPCCVESTINEIESDCVPEKKASGSPVDKEYQGKSTQNIYYDTIPWEVKKEPASATVK